MDHEGCCIEIVVEIEIDGGSVPELLVGVGVGVVVEVSDHHWWYPQGWSSVVRILH